VSSRTEEKRRRAAERAETARRVAAARSQRMRRLRAGAIAVVIAGGAAAAVVVLAAGGRGAGGTDLAPGEVAGALGQHYAGLKGRREAAGVTTMMDTMGSQAHYHSTLTISIDGRTLTVPPGIGIDPREDPMQMASLHTHDEPGVIHAEGIGSATLGQFFAVWGVPLGPARLGPRRGPVRMWVDGKRSRAFGDLELRDGQRIRLAVGRGNPQQ
jgi:hypothetical protein